MAAACSMFHRKLIESFRFSCRGEYIGGRAASGGGQVAPPPGGAGQGLAAPPYDVAGMAPLCLCFGLRVVLGKIGTSAFVSSNSKNISYVAFLKHKNSRK
jgi:hypothetical protein